ncbi:PREDICTED: nuclease HARBI1 [Prunus dulcis]|uniref:PREDICTED: nuclease HARBI1 n=1 Tax=Prunus dulcis TaxID=3755 RepID=A0A5E4FY26_PRUDU|nr:PREDICTED: nuclease HARBI1 [Prunus dulcis]
MFSKYQEAYCKDIEQCFGILQARFGIIRGDARFGIIRGDARMWNRATLRTIVIACVILHNMIVEDERDEDEEDSYVEEVDTMNPRKGLNAIFQICIIAKLHIGSVDLAGSLQ